MNVIAQIVNKLNDESKQLVGNRYYVLFYVSINDGELYAYDAHDPLRAHNSICSKHAEFEFLRVESYANDKAARDICNAIRLSRKIRLELIPAAELITVTVTMKTVNETYK